MFVTSGCTADAASSLKYDAIEDNSRRTLPPRDTRPEERVLRMEMRDKINSISRDTRRNNVIGAWMIRKHQDFVSDIVIRCGATDPGLKRELDKLIERAVAPANFDIAGNFGREEYTRIAEGCRTLEGDFAFMKLRSGHLQGFEADMIRDPQVGAGGIDNLDDWYNGVRVAKKGGRHIEYALHTLSKSGQFKFDRTVKARNFYLHAYRDRPRQTRGVTPLSTALNGLGYIYDLREFTHAKARAASLLGFKFTRRAVDDPDGDEQGLGPTVYADDTIAELDETVENKSKARIKFENGIATINLQEGEDLDTVESKTPPTELLNFIRFDVMLVLLALDLPFTFLDSGTANFFGGKGALQLYQRSAGHKQRGNIRLTRHWLVWQIREAIIAGEFTVPHGQTIADLPLAIFARGVPWWDKSKEIAGDLMAIGAGLGNPQQSAQEHDTDFYENVDETAAAVAYGNERLGEHGYRLNFTPPRPVYELQPAGEDDDADD